MSAETDSATAPRQWVVNDARGLEYRLVTDCDDAVVFAATLRDHHGRTAGHLAWRCHPAGAVQAAAQAAVQLEDLSVEDRVVSLGPAEELGRILRREPRTMTYRGRGLGSVLLQIAIAEARAASATRIYAYLCQEHVDRTPDLPRWLWHRGFVISDPPVGSPPGTVHWAYMDLRD